MINKNPQSAEADKRKHLKKQGHNLRELMPLMIYLHQEDFFILEKLAYFKSPPFQFRRPRPCNRSGDWIKEEGIQGKTLKRRELKLKIQREEGIEAV